MIAFLRSNRWRISIAAVLLLILLVVRFITLANVSHSASQVTIAHPDALTITVVLHRDATKTMKGVYIQTLYNATQSNQLYQEIVSAHRVNPGEVYSCPIMLTTYYSYKVDFQQKGKTAIEASADSTGCDFWVVKNLPNGDHVTYITNTANLWPDLHKYTGAPEPSQAPRG